MIYFFKPPIVAEEFLKMHDSIKIVDSIVEIIPRNIKIKIFLTSLLCKAIRKIIIY